MRVLVVHNRYRSAQPSGENAVVDDEARLLEARGAVVSRLEVESDAIATWSRVRRAQVPFRVVWSPRGARQVAGAIDRERPDVVHFHNTFPLLSAAALLAARRKGVAVVQTLHNFRALCPEGSFFRDGAPCTKCLGRIPLPALRYGCYRGSRVATAPLAVASALHGALRTWQRSVDRFVVPSEFGRRTYARAGWPAERLVVKYNTAADRRPPLGTAERRHFIALSRLSPEKGIDVLVEAWRGVGGRAGIPLLIVGSGESADELRRAARGVPDLEFRPQVSHEEGLSLLAEAHAIVVPSRCFEMFPRVVAEAFSLAVPVVAARVGSLETIVASRRDGLLFESASPDDLAEALCELAASEPLRRRLATGARARYEADFSPERTTDRLLEIYASACRDVRGAGAAG